MKTVKQITKIGIQIFVICFITLLLLESIYRYAIIDFYKAEANALNSQQDLNAKNVDVLVFGDSFSAAANNYVDLLRKEYPSKTFVNISIPGTGIKLVNTYAKKKLKKYQPKTIIYQVYVGNDLLDIKHLTNKKKLSFSRNTYWKLTDYFLSITYLNQKTKGLRTKSFKKSISTLKQDFSIKNYNSREKLLIKVDSNYLYNTVVLKNDFLNRYHNWKDKLDLFLTEIPTQTKVFIVFIPHCSQLNDYYFENTKKLNANFNSQLTYQKENYSFFNKANQDFSSYKNVSFLNPLSFLRKKDSLKNRLYFANDPHFNDLGQKELSNYLKETIFQ